MNTRQTVSLTVALLSMGLLGFGASLLWSRWMRPSADHDHSAVVAATEEIWTCSMHPQIKMDQPGLCPICNMDLIPLERGGESKVGPRELVLSPAAAALAEIRTAPVERRFAEHELHLTGKVAWDEQRMASISAWIPGRVDRLFVDYTGMAVRAGDHLFELYSPQLLTAQQELLQAKHLVDTTTDRDAFLQRSKLAALDSARDKLRLWGLTAAQVTAIEQAGIARDRTTIVAPTGGVVVRKNVKAGDYVATGDMLLTIADPSTVWILSEAYESDLAYLRYGQTVTISTESHPDRRFTGRITFIAPELDAKTRTIPVRVVVDNADGLLRPGMFTRATVAVRLGEGGRVLGGNLVGKWICPMHPEETAGGPGDCQICGMDLVAATELGITPEPAAVAPLVIPATAPLITGRRAVVYVRQAGAEPRFESRDVLLGPRAGNAYLVDKGLTEGELVVVNGNFKIDSALQIQSKPSMMDPEGLVITTTSTDGMTTTAREDRVTRRKQLHIVATPPQRQALGPVYTAYLTISQALAADDGAQARTGYTALDGAVAAVDAALFADDARVLWIELAADLRVTAGAITDDASIEALRRGLTRITAAVIVLERRFGHAGPATFYLNHCPMAFDNAGADWLQTDESLTNPYFGASMLHCGTTQESFPGTTESGSSHHGSGSEEK